MSTIDNLDELGVEVPPLASPPNVRLATNTKSELNNDWSSNKNCKV